MPVGLYNLSCVHMHDMPPCPASAEQRFGLLSHSKWWTHLPNPWSPVFKINIIELPCNIIQHSHSPLGGDGAASVKIWNGTKSLCVLKEASSENMDTFILFLYGLSSWYP